MSQYIYNISKLYYLEKKTDASSVLNLGSSSFYLPTYLSITYLICRQQLRYRLLLCAQVLILHIHVDFFFFTFLDELQSVIYNDNE